MGGDVGQEVGQAGDDARVRRLSDGTKTVGEGGQLATRDHLKMLYFSLKFVS